MPLWMGGEGGRMLWSSEVLGLLTDPPDSSRQLPGTIAGMRLELQLTSSVMYENRLFRHMPHSNHP